MLRLDTNKLLCLTFLFCFFVSNILAGPNFILDNDFVGKNKLNELSILEDENGDLDISEVIKSQDFIQNKDFVPNLGLSKSYFWIKIIVRNSSKFNDLLVSLEQPMLDDVSFFLCHGDKIKDSSFVSVKTPFYFREYLDPNFIFNLDIEENKTRTIFFKVKSSKPLILPIYLLKRSELYKGIGNRNLILGIYSGVMLVMLLYNLFVFFSVRDVGYIYYVGYILAIWIVQITVKGYSLKYIWSDSAWLAENGMCFLASIAGIIGFLFAKFFLQTRHFVPKLDSVILVFCFVFLISIVLQLLHLSHLSFLIMQLTTILGMLFVFIIGFVVWGKGYQPAKFFVGAWSAVILGSIFFVLKDYGIVPYNIITDHAVQIGSAIETVLLSFALADKINILKLEKIAVIKDKEKILAEQNVILEQQVTQRTEKLESTLDKLRSTQSQLVQSEKMASLGQLTAGMAHEINNPLNYMSQGVEILKEDINDLKSLIFKYDEVFEETEEIGNFKKDIQVDYVYKEMDDALSDIEDGIKRTVGITAGLKTFSRLNESSFKLASIHENLDSTLNLMKHEFALKKITVKKIYQADLDQIECNSGKLNQVFMNVLTNAVQAIGSIENRNNGEITVQTESVEDSLFISIKDDGAGMSEESRQKIFDPFFTTKDVGEGTGLGMSVVHGIVDEHSGKIEVISEVKVGTEIKISLPFVRN